MQNNKLDKALDGAGTLDWEKELCEKIDEILVAKNRAEQLRLVEDVIETVQDLVFTAFYKGTTLSQEEAVLLKSRTRTKH